MKQTLFGGHRRLLFRSYLVLVAGLLAVAVVLQLGFDQLQSTSAPERDTWLEATLAIVEAELAAASPAERPDVARRLSATTGLTIQLLQKDEVASSSDVSLDTLVDDDGNSWHLYASEALDELIYIGPVAEPRENRLLRFVPVLFYLSIFVVVGLWLRPLLTDINHIAGAAQRFAADYREPLSTAGKTTQLTGLAQNLDDMSARLSGLIENQKDMIAALSHEMRTPLARIRFALAVMEDKATEDLSKRLGALNADVQEIDELIAAMLNYARLDHPDLNMHWQDVPLEPWLEQTVAKFRQSPIEIELAREDGLDTATMDPRLMALALSNLLGNASRYASGRVRVSLGRAGDGFSLGVDDDGSGVPDAERDAVFKAFTRVDDSRNRETGGYGLGLAVVARIAALHGGSVRVERSADLGGASFILRWSRPAQTP